MLIAAKNLNDNDRMNSSSGAIFPLIAKKVIEMGGVVYGAAFNDSFCVEHISVNNIEQLHRLYGSKYVFSDCKVYPDVKDKLDKGIFVLFTGTPCQVFGLKQYLKHDYQNLITIDNICHGAPDQGLWKEYLKELSKGKKISSINFRNKDNGWRHYRFVIDFEDNTQYNVDHDSDLYMRGFIDNLTLREACYYCKFKGIKHRDSDITIGDLWGVWDFLPKMYDDKGTSLLFINSEKGKKIISNISDSIMIADVDEEKAINNNICAIRPSTKNVFRNKFIKDYKNTGNLINCLEKYIHPNVALKIYRKIVKSQK